MLFHTWVFFVFLLVVVPVYLALRKTQLWIPWLLIASYVFYGWWNPYYLILVFYSTALDYTLVALMDHCPRDKPKVGLTERMRNPRFDDRVLKWAFIVSACGALGAGVMAFVGLPSLRATMTAAAAILLLMAVGSTLLTMPVVTRLRSEWGYVHLLCSDGRTKHVSDAQVAERLRTMASAKQVSDQLLQDALDGGGTDNNITIVVGRAIPAASA